MKAFTLLLCLGLMGFPVYADVLLIEEVRTSQSMDLPKQGSTMEEVENRFGSPDARHPAVGEPPIVRWQYDTFSVYFEHNLVITSVLHHGAVIKQDGQES